MKLDVYGNSNQAANNKADRDNDDNPKENKQRERKHMRNLFTQFG
jgi:hypothetical protein